MTRLALALSVTLALVACGDKDDTSSAVDDTGATTDTGTAGDDTGGGGDGGDGGGPSGTGNCGDVGENTACVDLDGSDLEIGNGIAWDGQGSLAGSVRMMWGQDAGASAPPALLIDIPNTVSAGDTIDCASRPTYVQYKDADGNSWNANVDFAYWGAQCSITIDSIGLNPGDEVSGSYSTDAVNGDYTTDPLVGTFRVTIIAI